MPELNERWITRQASYHQIKKIINDRSYFQSLIQYRIELTNEKLMTRQIRLYLEKKVYMPI